MQRGAAPAAEVALANKAGERPAAQPMLHDELDAALPTGARALSERVCCARRVSPTR